MKDIFQKKNCKGDMTDTQNADNPPQPIVFCFPKIEYIVFYKPPIALLPPLLFVPLLSKGEDDMILQKNV